MRPTVYANDLLCTIDVLQGGYSMERTSPSKCATVVGCGKPFRLVRDSFKVREGQHPGVHAGGSHCESVLVCMFTQGPYLASC